MISSRSFWRQVVLKLWWWYRVTLSAAQATWCHWGICSALFDRWRLCPKCRCWRKSHTWKAGSQNRLLVIHIIKLFGLFAPNFRLNHKQTIQNCTTAVIKELQVVPTVSVLYKQKRCHKKCYKRREPHEEKLVLQWNSAHLTGGNWWTEING